MRDQIITLETAKLAREKGFNEPTFAMYNTEGILGSAKMDMHELANNYSGVYSAPNQSLLQKWLREVHNLAIVPYNNASGWLWEICKAGNPSEGNYSGGTSISWSQELGPNASGQWDTYEDALEYGLRESLKLIK